MNVRGRGTMIGMDDRPQEVQFLYTPDPRKASSPEDLALLRFDELSPEELREAYALARAAFTAADLQRYTELDEGVPVEDVLREMEQVQEQVDDKRSS